MDLLRFIDEIDRALERIKKKKLIAEAKAANVLGRPYLCEICNKPWNQHK